MLNKLQTFIYFKSFNYNISFAFLVNMLQVAFFVFELTFDEHHNIEKAWSSYNFKEVTEVLTMFFFRGFLSAHFLDMISTEHEHTRI